MLLPVEHLHSSRMCTCYIGVLNVLLYLVPVARNVNDVNFVGEGNIVAFN